MVNNLVGRQDSRLFGFYRWLSARTAAKLDDEAGGLDQKGIAVLFMGMLIIVVGLLIGQIVIDTAATTGASTNIASFTGVQSINDLAPLIFIIAVVGTGVALVGMSMAGFAGKGPMGG